MILALITLSFLIGFACGVLLILKKKPKAPTDIESSLKRAVIIPQALPPKPSETEIIQKERATTMEKKILYEEELSLIFKMGRDIFTNVTHENIAKSIAESANKMVNAQICTVLLQDRRSGILVPFYSHGVKEKIVAAMRYRLGESISGWVALNNKILVENNIEKSLWLKGQNKGEYFQNNLLSIPLSTKDHVVGVLNLSNKKSGEPFTEENIDFLKGLVTEASIALQNASLYEQLQESYLESISALAFALDARDAYTKQHSENVTRYAVAIAEEMNLKHFQVEQIRKAGMLHDIGKIGIRDGVLLKPIRLSDTEYNVIKQHALKGEAIVNALPFLKEEAKLIKHHHEKYDGTGYPDGLIGQAIELGARILAVADSLDAMISDRVYRKALGLNFACEELKIQSGKQFDPEVVNAFLRLTEKNPAFFASK
ncbi:MAG: HD domain-containing protein [Candidatus Omnitrophica bacterium]|nr:HD domain-containing protein [Candidatus Omnitrophota bacterium]